MIWPQGAVAHIYSLYSSDGEALTLLHAYYFFISHISYQYETLSRLKWNNHMAEMHVCWSPAKSEDICTRSENQIYLNWTYFWHSTCFIHYSSLCGLSGSWKMFSCLEDIICSQLHWNLVLTQHAFLFARSCLTLITHTLHNNQHYANDFITQKALSVPQLEHTTNQNV